MEWQKKYNKPTHLPTPQWTLLYRQRCPHGHGCARRRSCCCLHSWSLERCHSYMGRKAVLAVLWHRCDLTQAAKFRQRLIRVIVADMWVWLKRHHFVRRHRSFNLWTKSLLVSCNGGFSAIGVQVWLCGNTDPLLDHLSTLWRRQPALVFQDCTSSLENGRDAERACAATVKTEYKQCCTHQAYPAENFLAINKKLIEVHFVLWQNSQTAC